MTQQEFVAKWLPDYKNIVQHHVLENDASVALFLAKYFPDALAAFERYTWELACAMQREACAKAYIKQLCYSDLNHNAILTTPTPELKPKEDEK